MKRIIRRTVLPVLFALIVAAVIAPNTLLAQDRPADSAATAKLKALSEMNNLNDTAAIRILTESGADVNLTNQYGVTPLFIASREGHVGVVKLFIEAKADVNLTNTYGESPLFIASRQGRVGIVKLLIKERADVNIANQKGVTPLHIASDRGHAEIVKMLLEAEADVNNAAKDGFTPLLFASENGHSEVVKMLLEAKADVNVKVRYRGKIYTALILAKHGDHKHLVELLKKFGARE